MNVNVNCSLKFRKYLNRLLIKIMENIMPCYKFQAKYCLDPFLWPHFGGQSINKWYSNSILPYESGKGKSFKLTISDRLEKSDFIDSERRKGIGQFGQQQIAATNHRCLYTSTQDYMTSYRAIRDNFCLAATQIQILYR